MGMFVKRICLWSVTEIANEMLHEITFAIAFAQPIRMRYAILNVCPFAIAPAISSRMAYEGANAMAFSMAFDVSFADRSAMANMWMDAHTSVCADEDP